MAEAGEKAIRKKEREPIATVCLVVLLIASVAVLGVFINDNYISKNKETVEYGDSIELNYTGSLYAYYNDKSTYTPVIFDTSVESVGKDTGNAFIASFNKTSYATSTIKLDSATSGSGDFLKAFEDCLHVSVSGHIHLNQFTRIPNGIIEIGSCQLDMALVNQSR